VDVATAISYETGGKFDPTLAGPTTQWGTHRGLIQFGEPQAKQHGVDFSDPKTAWRSQLNPESGAVWSYLDSTGVQPGMGLPEIYSAINAGGVGRMGASDANNGGAPGTVADKVASMGPHREKAAQFLGGTWTPAAGAPGAAAAPGVSLAASGPGPNDIAMLSELAANPYLPEGQRAVVAALMQQAMTPPDPMAAIELEKAQLELDALKNPSAKQPESLTERLALLDAAGVDPNSPEAQSYLLTGQLPESPEPGFRVMTPDEVSQMGLPEGAYQVSPKGEIKAIGGGGTSVTVNNTPGGPDLGKLSTDYGYVLDPATGQAKIDPETGLPVAAPVPGSPAALEAAKVAAAGERKGGIKDASTDVITSAAQRAREADQKRVLTGLAGAAASYNPSTPNAEIYRQVDVLKSNAKIDNLQAMRDASPTGGALGAVTAPELKMLEDKAGALDPKSPNFARDLDEYERTLLRTIHGYEEGNLIFEETRAAASPATAAPATAATTAPPASFINDPGMIAEAAKIGVSVEEMWNMLDPKAQEALAASTAGGADAEGWTTLPNGVKIRVKQ
jgi:hypothetical protein